MKWINVDDRLPPNDICVLVNKYDHREKVKMHFVEMAYRLNNSWFYCSSGEELNPKYGYITHWMSLPDTVDKIVVDL